MKLRGLNYVAHILKPSLLFAGDAEAYLGGAPYIIHILKWDRS